VHVDNSEVTQTNGNQLSGIWKSNSITVPNDQRSVAQGT
jgi:hypothetical protein